MDNPTQSAVGHVDGAVVKHDSPWPRRDVELSRRQRENQRTIETLPLDKILADSTERPWTASASYTGESIYLGNDGQNAGAICGYADHPHNQANAALIFRAVNSFEPMRDALKQMLHALDMRLPPGEKSLADWARNAAERGSTDKIRGEGKATLAGIAALAAVGDHSPASTGKTVA